MENSNEQFPFDNSNLKRIIALSFIFLGIIFGYFLGWRMIAENRMKGGLIFTFMGIYFLTSLFWMFKSMKHLYIAVAIPFSIIVGFYLLYM